MYKANQQQVTPTSNESLPTIPDKRYFTIGEVARLCLLKTHVLRYWEQEFPVLRPNKRRGNRRYYQYRDVLLIRKIRHLLYDKGYTIAGARQQLSVAKQQPVYGEQARQLAKSVLADLEQTLQSFEEEV